MARIRTVKPELWTDPDFVALDPMARLLFIGCWNHADDYGVLPDDPERLRLQILPGDNVEAACLVTELVRTRFLLRRQTTDGTPVLVVRTFCVHQKIDKRAVGRWGKPEDFTTPPTLTPPIPTDPAESPPIPTIRTERSGVLTPPSPSAGDPVADRSSSDDDGFEAWWKLYPRKVAKAEAHQAWRKAFRGRNAPTTDLMRTRLLAQIRAWRVEGRQPDKVPHGATWLNGRRWEDDALAKPVVEDDGPVETYR